MYLMSSNDVKQQYLRSVNGWHFVVRDCLLAPGHSAPKLSHRN